MLTYTYSPVALFTYVRPVHTRKVVESLLRNTEAKDTDLIIFSDAPKSSSDLELVEEVRNYLEQITGFRSVVINCRERNFGLSKSIIDGVTNVLSQYESVIVLEDDIEVSEYFLEYMNKALLKFYNDDRVISIHGYVYPTDIELPTYFFLRGADCWGWGTWRRGWDLFNPNGTELLSEINAKKLISKFDFNDSYNFSRMLLDQTRGKNDSWAVRWYASAFLANKLTLYPGKSFVKNIGNDGSGTHCGPTDDFIVNYSLDCVTNFDTLCVQHSEIAFHAFEKFFNRLKRGVVSRIITKLKAWLMFLL